MNKLEVLTIVKDWIHDLSYINMETDVEHIMDTDGDTFKVYYISSEFIISITWLAHSESITILINHQFIASIENNGEIVYDESYYEEKLKPLVQFDIRSLISRLKHPPTKEFKAFCKGVEEWLSHLNNSTFKWYWYSPTVNSIGKCYKVNVGPFERLFHIENCDGGIILDINYNQTIKYIDGLVTVLPKSVIKPFTFEEISHLRDTIFSSMHNEENNLKIIRIEEILKQWLSDMSMTYTRNGEHAYIACITQRGLHPSTHAHIGVSVHEQNPCIWLYNTTNRIITFDPDNNWEPDMLTTYSNHYPFSHTNLTKLMAMYVKEFCGIDYEFRNTIFNTIEQFLKRRYHGRIALSKNNIKHVRWNFRGKIFEFVWVHDRWRVSTTNLGVHVRISDIYPSGDINMGSCIGSEEKGLINEIREAIKPVPDSTDEDLLESISKEYRTITDVLTDDFKKKVKERNTVINSSDINNVINVINAGDIQEFPSKIEVAESIFHHRPIDEIRKEFNDAVHSIKPETLWFDSMTDVIENIKKQEEKEMLIDETLAVKIVKQRGGMYIPEIKHVLFNETKLVTTVIFTDGDRVTSKCCDENVFDPEMGFAMCIMKKLYGNRTRFQKEIKKYHNAGIHRNIKIAEKAARKEKEKEENDAEI